MKETIPFLLKTESIINNLDCSSELKNIALSLVNDKRFVNYLYLIDNIKYIDNRFGKRIKINMNRDEHDVVWVDVIIFQNKVTLDSRYAGSIKYSNIEELLSDTTEDFRTGEIALRDRMDDDLITRISGDAFFLVEEDCPLKERWKHVLGNIDKRFYKWFYNSEYSIGNKSLCVWSKCKPLMIAITEYKFPIITVIYKNQIIFDDRVRSNNDWDVKLNKLFTKISNE